jgi:uncharacterized membrane protein
MTIYNLIIFILSYSMKWIFIIILVIIDSIYLSLFGKQFAKMIEVIQSEKFRINLLGAVLSYATIAFALYYFILRDNRPVYEAFILGVVLYGVFDFTNLALFNKYDFNIGLIDTLWGGILLASTTYITYYIHKMM